MDDQELIAEALEAIEELDVTYQPFDQHAKLGEPPWAGVQLKQWEDMHGHDVRLKCYPEFGCQVIDRPLAALVARLADALSAAAVRYRREGLALAADLAESHRIAAQYVANSPDLSRRTSDIEFGASVGAERVATAIRALLDENNETQEEKQ